MSSEEESEVENERKETRDAGSISMGVRKGVISSGDAKLICEIGEHGERYGSVSFGLVTGGSSSETNRSSDKALQAVVGLWLRRPAPPVIHRGGASRRA